MKKSNKGVNLLRELEFAKACLEDDIQQLAYINEALMLDDKDILTDIDLALNSLETLSKSMIYNSNQMQQAIDRTYKERKSLDE